MTQFLIGVVRGGAFVEIWQVPAPDVDAAIFQMRSQSERKGDLFFSMGVRS